MLKTNVFARPSQLSWIYEQACPPAASCRTSVLRSAAFSMVLFQSRIYASPILSKTCEAFVRLPEDLFLLLRTGYRSQRLSPFRSFLLPFAPGFRQMHCRRGPHGAWLLHDV